MTRREHDEAVATLVADWQAGDFDAEFFFEMVDHLASITDEEE